MSYTLCSICGGGAPGRPCRCGTLYGWPPQPQPWECPRCGKMHGPASLTCDCKPAATGGRDDV